ncbi:glycosyltransferase [Candidatus Micrarchaeota archaeon]|nr:glycosyltransferase [Candidatus Micrarchaeota archaeon]
MGTPAVSVILPVYNEERILERNVKRLAETLEAGGIGYEIIISEDGSTDNTAAIAHSLESEKIRIIHEKKRAGKGTAIRNAASAATGEVVIFMDADLSSDVKHIEELMEVMGEGADIAIGSRYLKKSRARRNRVRHFASKSFNFLVRLLLGSKLRDHQCGFKAFRKKSVLPIIDRIENKEWFWDAELLVRAQRKGLKIEEIPIEWKEAPDSKFRLLDDTLHMAYSLLSFKLKNG